MKEILFRGKPFIDIDFDEVNIHIKKEDFVYGSLIQDGDTHYIVNGIIQANEDVFQVEQWIRVIPETLGQFTGLLDKNGTKIFEGDNLSLDLNNEGIKTAQVNYRFGCFVFDTDKECYTLWESDVLENHIEVIGDIHEDNNNGKTKFYKKELEEKKDETK